MINILLAVVCILGGSACTITDCPNYGVVTPHLYRSGQPNAAGFKVLKESGVDVILKLSDEIEYSISREKREFGGNVVYLHIDQFPGGDYKAQAIKAAEWIQSKVSKGKNVLVHCHLGRDRTGLVVGIWRLMFTPATMNDVQNDWKIYGKPFNKFIVTLNEIAKEGGGK